MIFISATRLRVKSVLYLVGFIFTNEACVKQLNRTEGFLGGRELTDKNLTFWTVTMWDSEFSMKQFRNSLHIEKPCKNCRLGVMKHPIFIGHRPKIAFPDGKPYTKKCWQRGKLQK